MEHTLHRILINPIYFDRTILTTVQELSKSISNKITMKTWKVKLHMLQVGVPCSPVVQFQMNCTPLRCQLSQRPTQLMPASALTTTILWSSPESQERVRTLAKVIQVAHSLPRRTTNWLVLPHGVMAVVTVVSTLVSASTTIGLSNTITKRISTLAQLYLEHFT